MQEIKLWEEKLNEALKEISDNNNAHEVIKSQLECVTRCKSELEEDLDNMKKDQDDLLELLSDQTAKLTLYKTRLKELGDTVSFYHIEEPPILHTLH